MVGRDRILSTIGRYSIEESVRLMGVVCSARSLLVIS
jgi:hypothetical protein